MCRIDKSPRRGRKWLALAAALLLLPLARADEPTPVEANYKTSVAQQDAFVRSAQAAGKPYYPVTANAKYEGQTAVFQEFRVHRGDHVEAGDVIATVLVEGGDIARINATLSLTRAQEAYESGLKDYEERLRAAYDAVAQAPAGYERDMLRLKARRLESEYGQYKEEQEFSLARQEKALGELVEDNTVIEVLSPISGEIVTLPSMRDDTLIYDGTVMATVRREDILLLAVPNESDSFRYGMDVAVRAGNSRSYQDYPGRVVAADNVAPHAARKNVAFVAVDVDLENVNLSSITSVSVHCDTARVENAVLAPRNYATLDGGKYYVTIYEDGALKRRCVLVGDRNTDSVWILLGLEPGALLVQE